MLPRPAQDACVREKSAVKTFFASFKTFFQKKNIVLALLFILLYRLGESQLVKIASPFLMDGIENGGLGMSTQSVGIVYGTVGVLALTFGGILGGIVVAEGGLKKWLWPMVIAMNVPNLVYVYMAFMQVSNFYVVSLLVAIEQFGYGFGFTAFMLYLITISKGEFSTSHYAICTGFMALGMMLPGMFAGWIQEKIGYDWFFVWVCICTLPGIFLTPLIKKSLFQEKEEENILKK